LALSEDDEDDALSLGAAIDDDHEPSADVDSPPSDDESSVDEELVVGAEMLSEVGAADTNRLSDYDSQMQTVQSLRSRRSGWDSPLMLVGGGMLMLLIALGGFLWWQLNRESGDEMLQQAEADYEASSYGQAIDKYDHYLERFPDHKDRSIAKVHRGLAQIRQAEQSSNWPRALEVTNGVLAAISSEAAFGEARNELAAVLPKISAGLAQQAREQPSEELIASAGGALALVDKYVIKSLRPTEQLEETTATLARAHRDLGRDNALAAAVASINESVADGDTNAAYAARRQLLRDYPDLQDNDALSKAVLAISASMKDAVVLSDEHRGAVVDQPAPPFAAKVILSSLDPESERTSVKSPIAALVRGSLFGLDGSTGGVIWHRFLGALSTNPPVTLTDTSAGDFLVVDTQHQQLVRLDGRTGEARWSQPLAVSENENTESTSAVYTSAEPIEAAPAVFGRRVVTGDSAGALSLYDLDTGELVRRALLPQSLRIAPAVSTDGNTIYAVAEHSNLFVLDARTGDCHEVYYLGHEPGTVRIPPIVVGRYVVVAENHRLDDSRLRILLASEDGTSVSEIQQVDIQGHVTTPPVISGGTMIVVTDLHAINAFEVQPLGNDDPFAKVLSRPPSSEQHMLRFAAIADGQLLVADERLTLYDVRAAGGRLPPKAVFFEGNRFLQPLRVEGDTVFLVHQPAGQPGAIATAVHGRDGESLWSAHIASPVAGKLLVDDAGKRLMAATTNASLFQVNVDDSSRSGVVSEPMAKSPDSVADRLSTTTDNVRVDPRRIVLGDSSSHQRLLLCDLAGAAARLRWLNLPAPLGGTPCVMSEGIVAPGEVGQVFWLDADSGSQLASPFQTTLATDLKHHWHMAPLPKEDALIVADDATPILYRLGVEPGNQPALAAGAERELTAPIARGFAVSGEAAFAVDRDDRLLVINSTSLDELASHKLDAPAVWGPTVVGELVLIGTDSGAVQAFTVEGNPAWTHAASGERLVGATLRDNSNIVLGFDNGQVREVNTEAGETVGEVNLDRPLLRGPVMWQGRAVFAAPDGTIYAIDLP
jgi:outer membrane protein assembly factor BamB